MKTQRFFSIGYCVLNGRKTPAAIEFPSQDAMNMKDPQHMRALHVALNNIQQPFTTFPADSKDNRFAACIGAYEEVETTEDISLSQMRIQALKVPALSIRLPEPA